MWRVEYIEYKVVGRYKHDAVVYKQNTLALLKNKYARPLVQSWAEKTDPNKHVFEDLAIAAFLMELLKEYKPDLHDGLQKIAAAWDDESLREKVLSEVWPELEKIAIDHAVAEPASFDRRVAVVPATFGALIPEAVIFTLRVLMRTILLFRLG